MECVVLSIGHRMVKGIMRYLLWCYNLSAVHSSCTSACMHQRLLEQLCMRGSAVCLETGLTDWDPAPQAAEAGAREKKSVTPAMTLAHMTQLIMPQHANSLGITFGGQVGHAVKDILNICLL